MRWLSPRIRAALSVALTPVALVAACGGVVVVDEASDGAGGNASSSTGTTTTTTTTTTATTTTTTTPTEPAICDPLGSCDLPGGCLDCALGGPCSGELDACAMNVECFSYNDCASQCAPDDQVCLIGCEGQYPTGGPLFRALVNCSICWQCAESCAGSGYSCPL